MIYIIAAQVANSDVSSPLHQDGTSSFQMQKNKKSQPNYFPQLSLTTLQLLTTDYPMPGMCKNQSPGLDNKFRLSGFRIGWGNGVNHTNTLNQKLTF